MNSKIINLLGVVFVSFGLFTLMFIHLNHHHEEATEEEAEHVLEEQWIHIAVGSPLSILGALLLLLAEKREQTAVQKKKLSQ